MSTMVPMYGFGGGGGKGAALTVNAPAGCTVTVSKDGKTKTKVAGTDGVAVFKGLSDGEWTVTITDGSLTQSKKVTITMEYAVLIRFNSIPEFTYTGDYEIVNDADEPITTSEDHWKIRFLTSGTLTFTALNGAENGIDVFLVGGGGGGPGSGTSFGGGGGGYTRTEKGISVSVLNEYAIGIGAGGGTSVNGGTSRAFGLEASGGYKGVGSKGGAGGSGGAGEGHESIATDGANGAGSNGGKGQGTTTREFAEENGRLYASGGTGTNNHANKNPIYPNTGDGGHCGGTYVAGGSGIVIIRNAREVA